MKTVIQERPVKGFLFTLILPIAILRVNTVQVQSCPPPVTTTITSYFNTYYPGQQATVNAGSTSIALAAATYGTTGQKNVSKIITIQTALEEEVLNISPVPATSYSTITWSSARDIKLDITLFDEAGHAVLDRQYPLKKGVNELLLTNLETLPAGVYVVKAFDGAHHRNGKLIIHHTLKNTNYSQT